MAINYGGKTSSKNKMLLIGGLAILAFIAWKKGLLTKVTDLFKKKP